MVATQAEPIRLIWLGRPTRSWAPRRSPSPPTPPPSPSRTNATRSEFVKRFGIRHRYVETREFENPDYTRNDPNRCFTARMNYSAGSKKSARSSAYPQSPTASTKTTPETSAPATRRPGTCRARAPARGRSSPSPKSASSRGAKTCPTWDRPAAACLSSRIPYGTAVTRENVKLVEASEETLAALGFRIYRVRYHGELARIEVGRDERCRKPWIPKWPAFSQKTSKALVSSMLHSILKAIDKALLMKFWRRVKKESLFPIVS